MLCIACHALCMCEIYPEGLYVRGRRAQAGHVLSFHFPASGGILTWLEHVVRTEPLTSTLCGNDAGNVNLPWTCIHMLHPTQHHGYGRVGGGL